MNRFQIVIISVLGLGGYLLLLIWAGVESASYATVRTSLALDKPGPRYVSMGETITMDLSGHGFDADTQITMHMDINNQDAIIGSFPLSGVIYDMERVDNFLYVAGNGPGIRAFDVSNPGLPTMLRSANLRNDSVIDIERKGASLYLSCGLQGVKIAQISESGKLLNWNSLNTGPRL
jgi:hypothetical protein